MEGTVTNTPDFDALYSTLGEVYNYCSLDLSIIYIIIAFPNSFLSCETISLTNSLSTIEDSGVVISQC